jgi:hypothetical protein
VVHTELTGRQDQSPGPRDSQEVLEIISRQHDRMLPRRDLSCDGPTVRTPLQSFLDVPAQQPRL